MAAVKIPTESLHVLQFAWLQQIRNFGHSQIFEV